MNANETIIRIESTRQEVMRLNFLSEIYRLKQQKGGFGNSYLTKIRLMR